MSHAFSPSANSALGLPHFWGHTVAQLAVWASSGVMPVYGPIWSATFIALFAPPAPDGTAGAAVDARRGHRVGAVDSDQRRHAFHRKVRQSLERAQDRGREAVARAARDGVERLRPGGSRSRCWSGPRKACPRSPQGEGRSGRGCRRRPGRGRRGCLRRRCRGRSRRRPGRTTCRRRRTATPPGGDRLGAAGGGSAARVRRSLWPEIIDAPPALVGPVGADREGALDVALRGRAVRADPRSTCTCKTRRRGSPTRRVAARGRRAVAGGDPVGDPREATLPADVRREAHRAGARSPGTSARCRPTTPGRSGPPELAVSRSSSEAYAATAKSSCVGLPSASGARTSRTGRCSTGSPGAPCSGASGLRERSRMRIAAPSVATGSIVTRMKFAQPGRASPHGAGPPSGPRPPQRRAAVARTSVRSRKGRIGRNTSRGGRARRGDRVERVPRGSQTTRGRRGGRR